MCGGGEDYVRTEQDSTGTWEISTERDKTHVIHTQIDER